MGPPLDHRGISRDRSDAHGFAGDGRFCHGDTPTLADAFLVPQVYNAERSGVDMTLFPAIRRICQEYAKLETFDRARPERQPDAV